MHGERMQEPNGRETLRGCSGKIKGQAKGQGVELDCFQSNSEGGLVDCIHKAIGNVDGILINAGAYTHTSIALRDALLGAEIPYIDLAL